MNTEQIAEFKRACAVYMHPEKQFIIRDNELCVIEFDKVVVCNFDPYHDANDRNRVLEKIHADIRPSNRNPEEPCTWGVGAWGRTEDKDFPYTAFYEVRDTMEAAQIACIAKVLGVSQ